MQLLRAAAKIAASVTAAAAVLAVVATMAKKGAPACR